MYGLTKSNSMQVLLSVARELTLIILIILFVVPGFGDLYFDHGVTFKAVSFTFSSLIIIETLSKAI